MNTYMVYITPDLATQVKGERIIFNQDQSGNIVNTMIVSGECNLEINAVIPPSATIIKE